MKRRPLDRRWKKLLDWRRGRHGVRHAGCPGCPYCKPASEPGYWSRDRAAQRQNATALIYHPETDTWSER